MSLATVLSNTLDNSSEPECKRLKIADNAFKSLNLTFQNKEILLLKWAVEKCDSSGTGEFWDSIENWLSSEQFENNSRTACNEAIENFLEVYTKKLELIKHLNKNRRLIAVNCTCSLLKNRIFHQYFKSNIVVYCKFIAVVIRNIQDLSDLLVFIKSEYVFPRTVTSDDKFYKPFFENNLKEFPNILKTFNYDENLDEELSKLIKECIFLKNLKSFEITFKQIFGEEVDPEIQHLPKAILKLISLSYIENEDPKHIFKLVFDSFCKASFKKPDLIYRFFIIILEIIGFDCDALFNLSKLSKYRVNETVLSKSIEILSELLDSLAHISNITHCEINGKSLTQFLTDLTNSVMHLTKKPNQFCFKFLMNIIETNPLIIESVISNLLPYTILNDHTEYQMEYEMLLVSVFGIYAKLHRIQNLISKMIPSLKSGLDGADLEAGSCNFRGLNDFPNEQFKYNGNLFPETVLSYFSQCITNLASWQVINLSKTLNFHMNTALTELSNAAEELGKLVYIEIVSTLICCLLASVRIAEHTVPESVVSKFVKEMEELKDLQKVFGMIILNREHNDILMNAFLNICYTWAELYMMLGYYSDIEIKRVNDSYDFSACNLMYLHSYLTVGQWCLISERITNFGAEPCKQIMLKLFIQKLRAQHLFENKIKEEVILPVMKAINGDIENSLNVIINDKFVITHLSKYIIPTGILQVSEHFVSDIMGVNKWRILNRDFIMENQSINNTMVYCVFAKINKQMKQKRKLDEDIIWKPLSCKIFSRIKQDSFISEESQFLNLYTEIKELIHENLLTENQFNKKVNVDTGIITDYIKILQQLNVIFASEPFQSVVLYYLFSLHKDSSSLNNLDIKEKIEDLVIGIVQQNKFVFDTFLPSTLIQYIIANFKRLDDLFVIYVDNLIKKEKAVIHFQSGVEFLACNLKKLEYLSFSTVLLNTLNKWKKGKMTPSVKNAVTEYFSILQKKLVKFILKQTPECKLIEAYALLLKIALSKPDEETVSKLKPLLNSYLECGFKQSEEGSVKGFYLLCTTILRHKLQLEFGDEFYLKAWTSCRITDTSKSNMEEYLELITLIFEHVPNAMFQEMANSLESVTEKIISEKDCNSLQKYLAVWTSLLSSRFNPAKLKVWQGILQSLVSHLSSFSNETDFNPETFRAICDFIVAIIRNPHVPLTRVMCDYLLIFQTTLLVKKPSDFVECYNMSLNILTALLKIRNLFVMDRLPIFLDGYSQLLKTLCDNSNSEIQKSLDEVHKLSDCAHGLEKLTNNLVLWKKDMSRISCFLITEILQQFEKVTLYPNVKKHLNNCIYSLMSLCDNHAVAYLMRVLSSASTEMFRNTYDHYNKYYKFTGKV